jgi:hypothetical protein
MILPSQEDLLAGNIRHVDSPPSLFFGFFEILGGRIAVAIPTEFHVVPIFVHGVMLEII